jgi:CRP-like cAMP-binding protein
MTARKYVTTGNSLLAALPRNDLRQMMDDGMLEPAQCRLGEVLHERSERIEHVYFPDDCVISLMAVADARMTLEVGLVGPEGVAGIAIAMDSPVSPVRALVQRSGAALRMTASSFRDELERNPALRREISHYAYGLMVQATQAAFCSHFHLLESRLARSLLMMRDRVRSNALHLTHEFLSHALGVRRVGITKAATALQQRGLISYSRGDIRILDDAGLEVAACSCYQVVKGLAGRR